MIIVTNNSEFPIRRAAIEFAPGETKFKDGELSAGKQAQISAHYQLKVVHVEDRPTETTAKQAKALEKNA
ncbi:hypothetical protein [Alteromonas sp. AMM-1]|uniref:hypothetical protein n=1 Tax=Alteromonas sp. AMM-1 TaxID=3394233 RepID=UPI0039A45E8C